MKVTKGVFENMSNKNADTTIFSHDRGKSYSR